MLMLARFNRNIVRLVDEAPRGPDICASKMRRVLEKRRNDGGEGETAGAEWFGTPPARKLFTNKPGKHKSVQGLENHPVP